LGKALLSDLEKLVKLVKVVGVLLQTKVYLFWMKNIRLIFDSGYSQCP